MVNQKTVNEETLDILFKQSLSNKVFLALIMKECIDEYSFHLYCISPPTFFHQLV